MQTLDAPATSIVAHLPAVVAALSALRPGAACRIQRAAQLVAADKVRRIANVWFVGSEVDPANTYNVILVNGEWTCECEDYRHRGGPCKHGWATVLQQAVERLDADAGAPLEVA